MIMPFGKHRGKQVSTIPKNYLMWVVDNCHDISPTLRFELERQLELRLLSGRATPSVTFAKLSPDWYRQLAKEFHPDKRGSHDAMIAVNRAKELLTEMAEARR